MTDVQEQRPSMTMQVANAMVCVAQDPVRAGANSGARAFRRTGRADVRARGRPASGRAQAGRAGRRGQGPRDPDRLTEAATAAEFVAAVEGDRSAGGRSAFASAVDPGAATVFENFVFEPDGIGQPWFVDQRAAGSRGTVTRHFTAGPVLLGATIVARYPAAAHADAHRVEASAS